ncbi:MAG TPA: trypsin-like peptidase domain-containing protein [Anaerolineaceae bacterium]
MGAGVGILVLILSFMLHDLLRPYPPVVTQRDINQAVGIALASATPRPPNSVLAYQAIQPSVVLIKTTDKTNDENDGIGTGVIIDDAGLILSSLHVVTGASQIDIFFPDGFMSKARIVGELPEKDIVVLLPDVLPDNLIPAVLSSSTTLSVGSEVYAIGHPFGVTNSFTAGVVSGLGRSFTLPKTKERISGLIQFDAAVNPGNSGGPLVNRNGEVVGIITALLNPTEQSTFIGIGFAVPIDSAAEAAGSPPF